MTPERTAAIGDRLEADRAAGMRACVGRGRPPWRRLAQRVWRRVSRQSSSSSSPKRPSASALPSPLSRSTRWGPPSCSRHRGAKQKFLPAILNGSVEFAIGYSEPGAGSDLASLRTTAVATVTISSSMDRRCSPAAQRTPITFGWPCEPTQRQEAQGNFHPHCAHLISGFSWQPLHTMPGISTSTRSTTTCVFRRARLWPARIKAGS